MHKLYLFKKVLIVIWLLGCTYSLMGQHYNLDWVNSIGKNNNEAITSIAVDAAGNIYSAGYVQDTLDFNPGGNALVLPGIPATQIQDFQSSAFIYKCDPQGQAIWVRKLSGVSGTGVNAQSGPSVCVDSMGGIYMAGGFSGTVDFDPGTGVHNVTAMDQQDAFVLKLDSSGAFVWVRTVKGVGITSVANDAQGNVYFCGGVGMVADSVDFDPGPGVAKQEASFWNNLFVVKWTGSGNYAWARTIGAIVYARGIAVDRLGNVVVAGYYQDAADFDPGPGVHRLQTSSPGDQDIFVLKLNGSGNFVWARSMGGPGGDNGYAVAVDAWNNIYTTGFFGFDLSGGTPVSDFDPGPEQYTFRTTGAPDVFISKLSEAGNFVWARRLGGTSFDMGYSIAASAQGRIYTAMSVAIADSLGQGTFDFDPGPGYFNAQGTMGEEYQGVSVLDTGGNLVWGGITGPAGSLPICSNSHIINDRNGNIYLGGAYSLPNMPQGGRVDYDPGAGALWVNYGGHDGNAGLGFGTDIFLLKLGACVVHDTQRVQACNSYVYRGQTYTESGDYKEAAIRKPGVCDSFFHLQLTLDYSSLDTLQLTRCDSFLFNGRSYNQSGNYTEHFKTSGNCDSTVYLMLTISGTTPDTAIWQSGTTLTALADDATYQWLNCEGYSPVAGATEQSFKPSENGIYAVAVTGRGGCSDTSHCYEVSGITNIAVMELGDGLRIYPNPTEGMIKLQASRMMKDATLRCFNILGQEMIQPLKVGGTAFELDISKLLPGVYTIELWEGQSAIRTKVLKQ